MNMKVKVLQVCLLFMLFSCSNEIRSNSVDSGEFVDPNSARFGTLALGEEKEALKFSDLFSNEFSTLILESSKESLVGSINRLSQFKDKYIIKDNKQKAILIFDKDGKYINKITAKGKGPLEVSNIADYGLNIEKGSIDVYDFGMQKLVSFDSEGVPLSEIKFPYYAREISIDNLGNYYVYSPDLGNKYNENHIPSGLFVVDKDGVFVKSLLEFSAASSYVQPIRCLSGYGEQISFVSNYNEGVFTIKNGKLSRLFDIETDTEWLRSFVLSNSYGKNSFISYTGKDELTRNVYYNNETGDKTPLIGMFNDIFLAPIPLPDNFIGENQMASIMNAQDLINSFEMIRSSNIDELKKEFGEKALTQFSKLEKGLLKSVKVDDNPVIFLFAKK